MSSIPLTDGSNFGSVRYAKKVWEEYGLGPYEEKAKSPKKAKSAKGGKGKGGKGKKGKGGKGHQKKRAYSAREEEDSSDDRPQFDSEDEKWYAEEKKIPRTNGGPRNMKDNVTGLKRSERPLPLMTCSTREQACVRRDLERSAPQVCPHLIA